MRSPSFFQGVGMAVVLSLTGSAMFAIFTQVTDTSTALRLVIAAVAAGYALFLLSYSSARVGKVTTVLAWSAISGLSWILQADIVVYLLIHVGLLWLLRCLYFYRNLLLALMELGLQGLALAATFWALQETGSLLLCIWSFFLIQALFVAIPAPGFLHLPAATADGTTQEPRFQKAHRSAEAALRRLY